MFKIIVCMWMGVIGIVTGCASSRTSEFDSVSPSQRILWVSPEGNNRNSGTEHFPLGSIVEALARAKPGDIVQLHEGVYQESIEFTVSGTKQAPIILRGKVAEDGKLLSTIDPGTRLNSKYWEVAEDIGPDVWVYKNPHLQSIAQLVVGGKKLAALYHRAGEANVIQERPHSAWEILGWERDYQHTIRERDVEMTVPFWEVLRGVYYLSEDNVLYVRFGDGADPRERDIRVYTQEATIHLNDVSHVTIANLNIAACHYGVKIEGEDAKDNHIVGCHVYYGTERIAFLGGSSHGSVRDSMMGMKFYGWPTGAWAGEGRELDRLAKRFLYVYFKYWSSKHTISNDRSILLNHCRDIEVRNNRIVGGLIGIQLANVERGYIAENIVEDHSSVGVAVRENSSYVCIANNVFRNNSIQFRLHNLNAGRHDAVYFIGNLSILPNQLGNHIFSHVITQGNLIKEDQSPEIFFFNNSFIGGNSGLRLPAARVVAGGLPGFVLVNNLFAVGENPVHGHRLFFSGDMYVGLFDYNLLILPEEKSVPVAPWFGKHVEVEHGVVNSSYVTDSNRHLGRAVALWDLAELRNMNPSGFQWLKQKIDISGFKDIGAVQSATTE